MDADADGDADTDVDPCDVDGDGHEAATCGGDDCDDADRDVHPGAPDEEVEIETADSAARTGWYSSIGVDSAGDVYVAYYDLLDLDARVATLHEGTWSRESIDSDGSFGAYTNLAIGADDVVHVVYGDEMTGAEIRHASNESGAFSVETAVSGASPSRSGSGVAVDDDGFVHVAYQTCPAYGGCELLHATNASGAWTSEVIEGFGSAGSGATIAIGPSGELHVAHFNNNSLSYATNASGAWEARPIGGLTGGMGLAVGPDGTAHVVAFDVAASTLRHWTSANGWASEDIYPGLGGGDAADAITDASGAVHACFTLEPEGEGTADLIYVTNARGAWEVVRIAEGQTGYDCSIAVQGGGVHLSWFDAAAGVLRYARLGIPDDEDGDCDGAVEGPPWRPTSGLPPTQTLGDLGDDDWQTFCEWSIALQGGEGAVHECPDGDVTASTVADCVADSAAFAACTVPVSTAETCIRAVSDDPCEGYLDPACGTMFACAM